MLSLGGLAFRSLSRYLLVPYLVIARRLTSEIRTVYVWTILWLLLIFIGSKPTLQLLIYWHFNRSCQLLIYWHFNRSYELVISQVLNIIDLDLQCNLLPGSSSPYFLCFFNQTCMVTIVFLCFSQNFDHSQTCMVTGQIGIFSLPIPFSFLHGNWPQRLLSELYDNYRIPSP